MRLFNLYIILLTFLFTGNGVLFSQRSIRELDALAFKALEEHSGKAEEYANQILKKSPGNDSSQFVINANTILGIVHKDKGFYLSSLNYYIKALNAAEKSKDEGRVSAALNNIGVIYQLQRNFETAIKYFSNSLTIEEKLNNPLQKSIRYYNLGDCYKELDSFEIALSYFNNSLLIEQNKKNTEGVIYAYLGISEIYLEIGQPQDAKRMLDKIQETLSPQFIEESILYYKLSGIYYFNKQDMSNALSSFLVAENISKKNQYPNHLLEIYKREIKVFENLKDWKQLSEKYKEFTSLNDRLSAIEIRNKMHDLTYSNELQKKQLEISMIQEERDFAEKLNAYNKKTTWFLVLLVIFIVGFVVYGIQKRNK